ncbi:hypothetical protein [Ferrimicrobium acidiphilum]|jgi:hypothetical protein|uniref:Uncharacterized protein n=1 Tax=Ferrimicrobium acidiphilum DSM 19497 TaxID=1121877 RepID=A0A0D8FXL0_9ACTN|nr:hypothetical protein [Ferrimicrobium acidiphilum]KJE77955.1 hypothetical protein FEAC_03270 [Ferrimicrobium acidiphilum DSM 19497]
MRKSIFITVLVTIVVGVALAFFHIVNLQVATKVVVVVISLILVISSIPDQARAWLRFRNSRSLQSFEQAIEPDPLDALLLTYSSDKSAERQLCALLDDLLDAARRRGGDQIPAIQMRLRNPRSIDIATPSILDDDLLEHSLKLLEESWKLE